DALAAQRALAGGMRFDLHGDQRYARDADIGLAAAAVDDGCRAQHARTLVFQHFDHVLRAPAGGDDVLYHHRSLAWLDREAAAQRHLARLGVAFGEEERSAHGARHLMPDDDAAKRR